MSVARILGTTISLLCGSIPAQGPAMEPATSLLGNATVAPAAGDQGLADAAAGTTHVLAVWEDVRTDPYTTLQPSRGATDIWAARLDTAGQLVDRIPIAVNQDAGEQTDPHVAWNGTHWLVTWVSQVPTQFFYADALHAARVSAGGEVLDPTPIVVIANTTSNIEVWDVTSDGSGWTVIWKDWNGSTWDVLARRIDTTGVMLDPTPVAMFAIASQPFAGRAVFADDHYLVTWQHSNTVWARRVDPNLTPVGGQILVTNLSGTNAIPDVATDGDSFFVVFENSNTCCVGGGGKVYGVRINAAGVVLDPTPILLSQTTSFSTGRYPAVCWNGSEWLATWSYDESLGGLRAHGGRVSTGGVALDPGGFRLDPSVEVRQSENAAVGLPGGGALALWTDSRSGGPIPYDIHGVVVTGSAPGAAIAVSLSAPAQVEPDIVANDVGYMTVWASRTSAGAAILAQRVDEHGGVLDPTPIEVAPTGPGVGRPRVAFDGDVHLVVWVDGALVFGRRIDAQGLLLDPAPIAIMPGIEADVAAQPGTFMVADTHVPTNPQWRFPFAARVRASDGVVLDPSPIQLGQLFARYPSIAAIGNRFVVTWERHFSHDESRANIHAAFVELDGTTTGDFIVDGPFTLVLRTTAIASNGNDALIAFVDGTSPAAGPNVLARRLQNNGTISPRFFVSDAANEQSLPSLAWNGNEFVAAFEDLRNITFFVDDRKDVYGTRISATGALIDPTGFAIGTAVEPEVQPAIAGRQGSAAVVYAAMNPGAPFGSYRIAVRIISAPPCAGSTVDYGSGCPGTGGIAPTHGVIGCPSSGNGIVFALRDAAPGSAAALLLGVDRAAIQVGGCTVLVSPLLALGGLPISPGRTGEGQLDVPVVLGAIAGPIVLTSQFAVLDTGVPAGFTTTNGVETTLL